MGEGIDGRSDELRVYLNSVVALLQERFGVTDVFIDASFREGNATGGQRRWEGDPRFIYGILRQFCIEQETCWKNRIGIEVKGEME